MASISSKTAHFSVNKVHEIFNSTCGRRENIALSLLMRIRNDLPRIWILVLGYSDQVPEPALKLGKADLWHVFSVQENFFNINM